MRRRIDVGQPDRLARIAAHSLRRKGTQKSEETGQLAFGLYASSGRILIEQRADDGAMS